MHFNNFININGSDLNNLILKNNDLLILDVRGVGEHRFSHIPNSKNIPVQELNYQIENLDFYKNKEIVIYCASGGRSEVASTILARNGFEKVYNLVGGINSYLGSLV